MRLFCDQCNSTVDVNPPFSCPNCDADLRAQVASAAEPVFLAEDEMRNFYSRAVELTMANNDDEALATIDLGLSRLETPELHLLAALIHRKRQEYEQMRRHVAAIPADDSLRKEAEWLLRSHQEQQRMLRQTAQQTGRRSTRRRAVRQQPKTASNAEDQSPLGTFISHRWRQIRGYTWVWAFPTVALLAALILWQSPRLERWVGFVRLDNATFVMPAVGSENIEEPVIEETVLEESALEEPTVEVTAEETMAEETVADEPTEAAGQSTQLLDAVAPSPVTPKVIPTVEPTLQPTPLPTATPPPDIVAAPSPSPQPIAASGTAETLIVVSTSEQPVFDIAPYLELFGRADLSQLDLKARRQDETLVLEGVVASTQQRADLLDLAGRVPGIEEVNGIDLLIRLPDTYVVETSDTLWSIARDLYGDETRWTEIRDINQEQIGDGSLLAPGQELIVPPLQRNQ